MNERIIGQVKRVNGPVIEASGITDAMMLELVRVGEIRLVGEVIKLAGESAIIQVYEDTTGLAPGENIYGSGMPLSVELGPGLIGTIYDGIQRPLEDLLEISGEFIERGIQSPSLNREKKWHFVPEPLAEQSLVTPGMILGRVQETERVEHRILVPPDTEGRLLSLTAEGDYTVEEPVGLVDTNQGRKELYLMHRWPIRKLRPIKERLPSVSGGTSIRCSTLSV
ncbi:MAG: V-type ATP synthase subunit A, partial [Spirochaeta sp.]|nr:V-type ATP synthase subunit A [Spirochaeta sp.]